MYSSTVAFGLHSWCEVNNYVHIKTIGRVRSGYSTKWTRSARACNDSTSFACRRWRTDHHPNVWNNFDEVHSLYVIKSTFHSLVITFRSIPLNAKLHVWLGAMYWFLIHWQLNCQVKFMCVLMGIGSSRRYKLGDVRVLSQKYFFICIKSVN